MVLTSTHNLCFEEKFEKYQNFLSDNFHFLEVKFSIYLNRLVCVMKCVNDYQAKKLLLSMSLFFILNQ